MKLPKMVRRARQAKGLRQRGIEKRMKLPPTTMCHVEAGRRNLSKKRRVQLARILGLDVDVLMAARK